MIKIVQKQCSKVNCFNLIPFNESYCEKHKDEKAKQHKKYDELRFTTEPHIRKFYSSKVWKNTRNSVMMEHDWVCANCKRNNLITPAKIVDHIVEVKDDWDRRLDTDNLEPLCHSCHNKKTADERKRRNG